MSQLLDQIEEIERELQDYVHAFQERKKEQDLEFGENQLLAGWYRPEAFDELRQMARIDQNFPIRSHRRLLGPLLVFSKKAVRRLLRWYIDAIVHHQNQINSRMIDFFERQMKQLSYAAQTQVEAESQVHLQQMQVLLAKVGELRAKVEQQQGAMESRYASFTEIAVSSTTEAVERANRRTEALEVRLAEEMRLMQAQLRKLKSIATQSPIVAEPPAVRFEGEVQAPAQHDGIEFDYYQFEEKYRGSWELIRERQQKYVRFFAPGESVLDIGCGRGEFVSLMVEHGVNVSGIDLDRFMLSVAEEKGLPVQQADAHEYLQHVPDRSLDGIFMSHVVEHIPTNLMVSLLDQCFRKLRYGGRIILETPNPLSLLIFSNSFYMDPTHQKPIHPETLKFMLNQVGFEVTETIFSGDIEPEHKMQFLPVEKQMEELNRNFDKLNHWLYGPQDYAVVAVRK